MENIIVIIIVAVAAGLLGRSYYKKYKKGNQCGCGCTDCAADISTCEFPEAKEEQIRESRKST